MEVLPIHEWLSMWQRNSRWPKHVADQIESLNALLGNLTTRMWIQPDPDNYSWKALFYYSDQQLYKVVAKIVTDAPNGLVFDIQPSQEKPTGTALSDSSSPWKRSMLWTRAILKPMEGYKDQVEDIDDRMGLYKQLNNLKNSTVKQINKSFQQLFGRKSQLPSQVDVAIADWFIMPGKIAAYTPPIHTSHGKVTIARRAFQDWTYVKDILLHELIHGAFGIDGCLGQCTIRSHADTHHEDFRRLATVLGLPKKYQD